MHLPELMDLMLELASKISLLDWWLEFWINSGLYKEMLEHPLQDSLQMSDGLGIWEWIDQRLTADPSSPFPPNPQETLDSAFISSLY